MNLYDEDNMLMLSGIQHYMFCPRQWALIHIEQQWAEPICSQIYYFCKLIINRLSTIESHPLWVRGLKRGIHKCGLGMACVAPLVGAWNESLTAQFFEQTKDRIFIPFTDLQFVPNEDKPSPFCCNLN